MLGCRVLCKGVFQTLEFQAAIMWMYRVLRP